MYVLKNFIIFVNKLIWNFDASLLTVPPAKTNVSSIAMLYCTYRPSYTTI